MLSQHKHRDLIIIGIVTACIFLPYLDLFVVNIMEARNFTTAREMVELNHWLLPTMNGEPRYEKPPLPTWLTALAYYFGGDRIFFLRLPAALIAMVMVFFQYFFSRTLTGDHRQALINSLILATSFYIVYLGRTGTWDIFCHSFMLGAIYCLFRAFHQDSGYHKYFIWSGIWMGLSYLSKGPISFYALLLPFLLAHIIAYGKTEMRGRWKSVIMMVLLFVVLSFWWMLYIYLVDADTGTEVLKKETTAWLTRHTRPFWHYWSFPVQSGIWTTLLVSGLMYRYCLKRLALTKEYKLAFWWTVLSVVLLSLFPEKKERYLMPVLIPGSLCIGFYVRLLIRHFHLRKHAPLAVSIPAIINFGIPILLCLTIPVIYYLLVYSVYDISLAQLLLTSVLFWGLALYMIRQLYLRQVYRLTYAVVSIIVVSILFMTPTVNYFFNSNPERHEFSMLKSEPSYANMNFYASEALRPELMWEIGRIVKPWADYPAIPQTATFGLFTESPIENTLPSEVLSKFNYRLEDVFDINYLPPASKKYRSHFKRHFYIVSPLAEN